MHVYERDKCTLGKPREARRGSRSRHGPHRKARKQHCSRESLPNVRNEIVVRFSMIAWMAFSFKQEERTATPGNILR